MIDGEYAIGFTHNRMREEQRQRAQNKGSSRPVVGESYL
jgi:hypothetical protein